MFLAKYISIIIILSSLIGCFNNDCKSLSCDDLTDDDFSEMSALGVTISGRFSEEFSYEFRDSQAVLVGIQFDLLPAPGTEQYIPPVASFYNEISDRSTVYFKDINGVVLNYSNIPQCFSTRGNNVSGTDSPDSVPPGMNFSLQTELDCVPATANRIVHEYENPDGTSQKIFDIELNQLRNWRIFVTPLICENQSC